MKALLITTSILLLAFLQTITIAAETLNLIDAKKPLKNWSFNNGPEFPGAKGGLHADNTVQKQRQPAIRLDGDFTGGGNYVQTGLKFPAVDVEGLSFWLKAPKGKKHITMRLIDGSGQCHQINYKINPDGNWQQVNFPVEKYFAKAGTSSSVEQVIRYEGWGGAKDGKWHNPGKGLYLLCGKNDFGDAKKGSILISGVKLTVAPKKQEIVKKERLDDFLREGEVAWSFNDGREFPGAKGGLTIAKDQPEAGQFALDFKGDFTGGGAYVSMGRGLNGMDITKIKMKVKSDNTSQFGVRLIDSTGQCHQAKSFKVVADGKWHEMEIPVSRVVGGEHWGGAKDGKWHGGAKSFHMLVGKSSSPDKKPQLLITDIRADVKSMAAINGKPYSESFDKSTKLPQGWSIKGPAKTASIIKNKQAFDGKNVLRVSRTEDQVNDALTIFGKSFKASQGPWSISGATRSELYSPDNSFAYRLNIEALDAGGNVLMRNTIVDQTGKKNWKPFNKQIQFPAGTANARFTLTTHKTYGFTDMDALAAIPLAIEQKESIVDRIVIGSSATGNMFLPEDEVKLIIDIQSTKPLPQDNRSVQATITDYWGAEQLPIQTLALKRNGVTKQRFRYSTSITLPKNKIDMGKYYELHIDMPLKGYEDANEYSAFVRLPEAASRKYKPLEIPFTIRSWDNRIPAYMKLASRLGHRNLGVWGGWSKKDPKKVHLPGLELVQKLGNNFVTGTPASDVERHGFKNYSEENLREGTTNFLKKFADQGLSYICLGNEPSEREDKIAEKVKAYKAVYEAVKAYDPSIKVIATSVPALDSFFKAGFQNYCDIYDFHVYETYERVRNGVRRYKELGKKYNAEKPIFCTELGLNSQGQTRYAVAKELVKKITAFFAEGGQNVSWFGIEYPDTNGKARGGSGNSHNTFDCQYNQYNPRLDAVMYYNMINGILIKKFVDEVQHPDGVQDFLFRDKDGNCMHILWHEGGRVDHGIKLPGVTEAKLICIDGSSQKVVPANGTITLSISGEPVMLLYNSSNTKLAKEFAPAAISVEDKNYTILKNATTDLIITGKGLKADQLQAILPPRWSASFKQSGSDKVVCTITAPETTIARTGRLMLQKKSANGITGEIIIPLTIMSPIAVDVFATSANKDGNPGLLAKVVNNGKEPKKLNWTMEVLEAFPIKRGSFKLNDSKSVSVYLKGESEGQMTLDGGKTRDLNASIIDTDPQTIYKVRVSVTDEMGRKVVNERYVGGFASARFTDKAPAIDGELDEAIWKNAPIQRINEKRQFMPMNHVKDQADQLWTSPEDLSATWQAAWDDKYLYLAVKVTDDIHRVQFSGGAIWNQDGLQFLFDPAREQSEKAGKYDYSMGKGTKGEEAICHLTADSTVATGPASEIKLSVKPLAGSAGGRVYEIAIPWSRLAPFKPAAGMNLGMSMILNEDDGDGRIGFLGWFSGVHSKQLDLAGDLILDK